MPMPMHDLIHVKQGAGWTMGDDLIRIVDQHMCTVRHRGVVLDHCRATY
jgi:hypothetical protein